MGFIDSTGNVIIDCKFDYVGDFQDGLAIAVIDSLYGYINSRGEFEIPCEFNVINHIKVGYEHSFFNTNDSENLKKFLSHLKSPGDTLFNYNLPEFLNFSENRAVYYKDGKYGYLDTKGEIIIPAKYINARKFSEGLAAIESKDSDSEKWGYINYKGDIVIKPQYSSAGDFSEGKATATIFYDYTDESTSNKLLNSKLFVINKTGHILLTPDVQFVSEFHNGWAACFNIAYNMMYSTGANFIDTLGNFYTPYDKLAFKKVGLVTDIGEFGGSDSVASEFIGKLFLAQHENGKWGFLPENLNSLTKSRDEIFIYEDSYNFHDNIAAVKINNKWGFINPLESVIIKPQYTKVNSFKNGLAYVEQNENGYKLSGYINKKGVMIWSSN